MKEFNIDNLLETNSSENQEINNEPTPVIEKVSLNEINEEIEDQDIENVKSLFSEYFSLTPDQKEVFKNELFCLNTGDDKDGE